MSTGFDSPSRAAQISQTIAEQTGLDDLLIGRLVDEFYARVRADDLLAPIFEARITDWAPHLRRMRAFWSSVALMSGEYHGSPMHLHLPLPVEGVHFARWLALFEAAAGDVCPPAAAAHLIERARRIAKSLELGIALNRERRRAAGERHPEPVLNVSNGRARQ